MMHTKNRLSAALRAIGLADTSGKAQTLFAMADKAAQGYYDDFLSPLDLPTLQLVSELGAIGTPGAIGLSRRVVAGEFDATKEESDEWAASEEGQEVFDRLIRGK
jgi:hypothetical protein